MALRRGDRLGLRCAGLHGSRDLAAGMLHADGRVESLSLMARPTLAPLKAAATTLQQGRVYDHNDHLIVVAAVFAGPEQLRRRRCHPFAADRLGFQVLAIPFPP